MLPTIIQCSWSSPKRSLADDRLVIEGVKDFFFSLNACIPYLVATTSNFLFFFCSRGVNYRLAP